jgi:hypothetical protein
VAARLKLFVTSDGLTDYFVATTSRAKALAAWGVRQDLFKDGRAREVRDPAIEKDERPGEVLSRPASSKGAAQPTRPRKPAPHRRAPAAAARRVAELQAKLSALDEGFTAARREREARRQALDAEERRETKAHEAAREALRACLSQARRRLAD